MKIEIEINTLENVGQITQESLVRYAEIFKVLIERGCLDGIKGGSVELHFDSQGVFMGPEVHYWPWRRRRT